MRLDPGARGNRQSYPQHGVVAQTRNGFGQRRRIAGRHDQTAVADDAPGIADIRRHDRDA